jgi:excisionase family DNA binding protein
MPSPKKHTFASDSLLTSYQVGALLQVNPSSINKWIADGRIPAYRTPGGHRRIHAADLLSFLTAHKMPIPKGLMLSPTQGRLVLAISDDPLVLAPLKQHLGAHSGVTVTFAQDGIDGLMRLGQQTPDLVVLGPTQAPLDHVDLCRRLRAASKTAKVKIAVVLLGASAEHAGRIKHAGANVVLTAPVQGADWLALLQLTA